MLHIIADSENQDPKEAKLYVVGTVEGYETPQTIIAHETLFGAGKDDELNSGENVIDAICRTASNDQESPGAALESLLTQVFRMGVKCGTEHERNRIITRVTGD